jgi:hypothetical protein
MVRASMLAPNLIGWTFQYHPTQTSPIGRAQRIFRFHANIIEVITSRLIARPNNYYLELPKGLAEPLHCIARKNQVD